MDVVQCFEQLEHDFFHDLFASDNGLVERCKVEVFHDEPSSALFGVEIERLISDDAGVSESFHHHEVFLEMSNMFLFE